MKTKEKIHVLHNNFWMLRKIWHYTPDYVIWMLVKGLVVGIHNSIDILYTNWLFNAIGKKAPLSSALRPVAAYAIYLFIYTLFYLWYQQIYNPKVRERLHIAMHSELFQQAVRIDLEKYDDPDFYNDFVWSMEQSLEHAAGLMEDTGMLISRIVASITLTGVLLQINVWIAITVLGSAVAVILLSFLQNRWKLKFQNAINPIERKSKYIRRVFMLPDFAKELRTSAVTENLFSAYQETMKEKRKTNLRYGRKVVLLEWGINSIQVLGDGGLMLLTLYLLLVRKSLGLGAFAISVNAGARMQWVLSELIRRLMKYHEHGIFIEKIIRFLNCEPKITDGSLEAEPFETLEVKNVSFAYPSGTKEGKASEKKALKEVNFTIRRGEKIAIVGYNGAGKTTLTKLIMRLYDPDSGEICYNGRSLKEYTLDSLRSRMASVFQDYRIFAASIAENVVGGDFDQEQAEAVEAALEKSTFADKLKTLPKGIDTQLTREFDAEGTQLSGGEQQKIAIARAFYRNAELIILDEPSSALDPDGEYALNQAIASYAEDRTVIFISHRLSSTRLADRIYMFADGVLAECGTHEELMQANGKYAYMFRLQAEKYAKTSS